MMSQILYATVADLWDSVKKTGSKVSSFLLDQCEVKDVVIIGMVLWIL